MPLFRPSISVSPRVTIRPMTDADPFPLSYVDWGPSNLLHTHADFRSMRRLKGSRGYVALDTQTRCIAGYDFLRLGRGHVRILDLAVHPESRRRGIGRQMIGNAKLLVDVAPSRRKRVLAIVPDWNLGMHLLLQTCRFRATEVIRDHDMHGDGYLFVYEAKE